MYLTVGEYEPSGLDRFAVPLNFLWRFRKVGCHKLCGAGITSPSWRICMIGKNKERWFELCERAVVEQDSTKLLELVREISDLLQQKH